MNDPPYINRLFSNLLYHSNSTFFKYVSNFAINYTTQKEKRIENNPNAQKFKLEITILENEN